MSEKGHTVEFKSGQTETRECPECRSQVLVPVETPHVWCPCEKKGVPMRPLSNDTDSEGSDGG